MGYLKIRLLLAASEEAYKANKINDAEYFKILDDLEKEVLSIDALQTDLDFENFILKYTES